MIKNNEIQLASKISEKEEINYLLNNNSRNSISSRTMSETLLEESLATDGKRKNNCIRKIPFIIYFFIFSCIFMIILIIIYIHFYKTSNPNFKIVELPWINPELNDRKYQDYIFNNELEVMLIQDTKFDMDGGAIVIESGYMDNPFEEGISSLASSLLSHIVFNDSYNIPILKDYFGNYDYDINEYFTNFRFDILNNGFKKFLGYFSFLLNPKNLSKFFDDFYKYLLIEVNYNYQRKIDYIDYKENHLLEYLVYGFKNEIDGKDILPEGSFNSLSKYNVDELKNKTLDYIYRLIDPKKIKIVLFSKYKFLISSNYMKYYFNYLINKEQPVYNHTNKNINFEKKIFNKSQIFYIKTKYYEYNYIKIIYYIDKIKNETFSELYYKSAYFEYIKDFFYDNKEDSLYSLLTNKYNIKSITVDFDVILKSKIHFYIILELNTLNNINDIIFLTYQYMYKIIKNAIGSNMQTDRYIQIKDICYQKTNYTEKTLDTMSLAESNGENIILTKYKPKYYFYYHCLPWYNEKDNLEIIKKESESYFNQLKPENSVIILGLRDQEKNELECNDSSPFYLNCSYFKDGNGTINTTYYDICYKKDIFISSEFEQYLDINNDFNISFTNNTYSSKQNKSYINMKKEENDFIQLKNNGNSFNKFYFKRNVNFHVPKVYISLNFFHPYLRPNNTYLNHRKCYYFKIIEFFAAIKHQIQLQLSDALKGSNSIEFGQNENYLYINVYSYEDVAYKIMKKIRNIIFDTNWTTSDFITKNEIYKREAFNDFFLFNKKNILEISRYYLYCKLKNNLFNKYEFFMDEFNEEYYDQCISDLGKEIPYLSTFAINGTIYGFYTEEQAQNISDLFNSKNISLKFHEMLEKVEIKNMNFREYFNWLTKINKLEKSEKTNINITIYDKSKEDFTNYGIRYISFKEKLINVSLFNTLFQRAEIDYYSPFISFEMFAYRDIYFELLFYSENKTEIIPYDDLVKTEWEKKLNNCYTYNAHVDNIGNRYYYVKKNFLLYLIKQQTSLEQRAIDEILGYQDVGIILDPAKIWEEYQNEFNGKSFDEKELDNTIRYYSNIINRIYLDIYTVGDDV